MVEKSARPVDDGKTKAEPGTSITVRFADTVELAEYLLVLVLGNSGSRVPHLDPHRVVTPAATDNQSPVRRVAHRIGHQIEQYPFEQDEVAAHPSTARDGSQRQSLFPCRAREGGFDSLEQFPHWTFGPFREQ